MSTHIYVLMQVSDEGPPKPFVPGARFLATFLTEAEAESYKDEQIHKVAKNLRVVEFSNVPEEGEG